MAVKKAVQCGNVEDAIEKVNDLNPEVQRTTAIPPFTSGLILSCLFVFIKW